jgi:hypothetical protein
MLKKICIIGNGVGSIRKENGKFVDSCDEVVRIKNFETRGFEKYIGSKTTIYSSKWFAWFDRKIRNKPLKFTFLDEVHTLMFMFPNEFIKEDPNNNFNAYTLLYKQLQLKNELPPIPNKNWKGHIECLNMFGVEKKKAIHFSLNDVEQLCINILKIHNKNYVRSLKKIIEPTCGIRTVFKILQIYPDAEIFLTGFDCFQSGWYWDQSHKIKAVHYYLDELLYFGQLKKMENVTFLD